jgi:hypothetical protein
MQEFLNEYDRYCASCTYAYSWINTIISQGMCLQGNPNYDSALSSEERSALETNVSSAQASGIVPVSPPSNRI